MSDRNSNKWREINKINLPMVGIFIVLFKNYLRLADYIDRPEWADDILSVMILVVFALSMMRKKYNIMQFVMISGIAILAFYTGMVTGYMVLTVTVLTMLMLVDEYMDRIIRFMFYVTGIFLTFNTLYTIVLWSLGFAEIGGFTEGTRYRLHFGYGMAGHFADCILNMMMMWTWIHYKKLNFKSYLMLFLLTVLTYWTTDTRVIFVISILFILGLVLIKQSSFFEKLVVNTAKIIVPLCTVIMFWVVNLFGAGNKTAYFIDDLINTRVRLCGYYFDQYGATLFGQYCPNGAAKEWDPKWHTPGGTYDDVYMWLIVNMGIIWIILISIAFWMLAGTKNSLLCLMIIVWALGAVIDTDFLNGACSFIILMPSVLLGRNYCGRKTDSAGELECRHDGCKESCRC